VGIKDDWPIYPRQNRSWHKGQKYKLLQNDYKVDIEKLYFSERVVKLCNALGVEELDFSNNDY